VWRSIGGRRIRQRQMLDSPLWLTGSLEVGPERQ